MIVIRNRLSLRPWCECAAERGMLADLSEQKSVRDVLCEQEAGDEMMDAASLPAVGTQHKRTEATLTGWQRHWSCGHVTYILKHTEATPTGWQRHWSCGHVTYILKHTEATPTGWQRHWSCGHVTYILKPSNWGLDVEHTVCKW